MRSSLNSMLQWLHEINHPSSGTLVEFLDGQFNPNRTAKLRAHIKQCVRCRMRLEQLQEGLQYFRAVTDESIPHFSVEDNLRALKVSLEQRARPLPQASLDGGALPARALYDRLLAELSIYIGRRTAMRLLDRCNHDMLRREGFSEVVEPVVTAFLGKHAGTAVLANVLRIWDRTQQVPS